jgi:hypothetical protein
MFIEALPLRGASMSLCGTITQAIMMTRSLRKMTMDFQNRVGSKVGSGGVASTSESNRDRRERLRQLAMETIDLNKVWQAHETLI